MDFGPPAKRKAGIVYHALADRSKRPRLVTCIRALSTPMLVAKTGELCKKLRIASGTIYTIGRSKRGCDIIFLDTRVSRQHCQLYLDPQNDSLILLDGAVPGHPEPNSRQYGEPSSNEEDLILPRPGQRAESSALTKDEFFWAKTDAETQGTRFANRRDPSGRFRQGEKPSTDLLFSNKQHMNRSLNGIFVNGHRLESGAFKVLSLGDEVSLVGSTKVGRSSDPNCLQTVGFFVEREPEPSMEKTRCAQSCVSVLTDVCSDTSSFSGGREQGIRFTTMECGQDNSHRVAGDGAMRNKSLMHSSTCDAHEGSPQTESGSKGPEGLKIEMNAKSELREEVDTAKDIVSKILKELLNIEGAGNICTTETKTCTKLPSWDIHMDPSCTTTPSTSLTSSLMAEQSIGSVTYDYTRLKLQDVSHDYTRHKLQDCSSNPIFSLERMNMESTLVSTFNLIEASIKLRSCVSEILNGHNRGEIMIDEKESDSFQPTRKERNPPHEIKEDLLAARESFQVVNFPVSYLSCPSRSLETQHGRIPGCALIRESKEDDFHAGGEACSVNLASAVDMGNLKRTNLSCATVERSEQMLVVETTKKVIAEVEGEILGRKGCGYQSKKAHYIGLEHSHTRCSAEILQLLLKRDSNLSEGCSWQAECGPHLSGHCKDNVRVDLGTNAANIQGELIHGKEYALLEYLRGEQLKQKSLLTCRLKGACSATDDARVTVEDLLFDLCANASQPTKKMITAQVLDGSVKICSIGKGLLDLPKTSLDTAELKRKDEYKLALFASSGPSGHENLQGEMSIRTQQRRKEEAESLQDITAYSISRTNTAVCISDGEKETYSLERLRGPAASVSSDRVGECNTGIVRKPPDISAKVVHIDLLTSENQNGENEAGIAEAPVKVVEKRISSGGKVDIVEGDHSYLKEASLMECVKGVTVEENHHSTEPRACAWPVVVGIEVTEEPTEQTYMAEPSIVSQAKDAAEKDEKISSVICEINLGHSAQCELAGAKVGFGSQDRVLSAVPSDKMDLLEQGDCFCASKEQEGLHLRKDCCISDVNMGIRDVHLTREHLNSNFGDFSAEMHEESLRGPQSSKNALKELVNPGMSKINECTEFQTTIQSQVKRAVEVAVKNTEPEHNVMQSHVCQVTNALEVADKITKPVPDICKEQGCEGNSECCYNTSAVRGDQQDRNESFESLEFGGVSMEAVQCRSLLGKDKIEQGEETAVLQDLQSTGDNPQLPGFFLNRLKAVGTESVNYPISVSLQDLLAPVEDLRAVFIATFTYDIPCPGFSVYAFEK